MTRLAPNIEHLLIFNLAIHLAATLLLALLVSELATSLGNGRTTHAALVLLAAATYLFTFEALYSHGIIYWHHSLFQVVWLTQLIVAARVFRAADDGTPLRRRDVAMLIGASVLAPAVEWAGHLTSGLMAPLARGYVDSFGALLILVPAVAAIYVAAVRRRPATWIVALILVTVLPLVENPLLAQHATLYHFDRLKALVPIVTVSAISIALLPARLQSRLLLVWLAIFAWNLKDLRRSRSIAVSPPLSTNEILMRRVRMIAKPCAIYATNVQARGWVELSLGGNAYETIPTVDSLASLVRERGACQGFYFGAAVSAGEDMYIWRDAVVIDVNTGAVERIDSASARR